MNTFLGFLVGFIIWLLFCMAYFIGLEQWRRHKCKIGQHAGHVRNGKLVCHTCGGEFD